MTVQQRMQGLRCSQEGRAMTEQRRQPLRASACLRNVLPGVVTLVLTWTYDIWSYKETVAHATMGAETHVVESKLKLKNTSPGKRAPKRHK